MNKKNIIKISAGLAFSIVFSLLSTSIDRNVFAGSTNVTLNNNNEQDIYTDDALMSGYSYPDSNRISFTDSYCTGTTRVNYVGSNVSAFLLNRQKSAMKFDISAFSGTINSAILTIHVVDAENAPIVNLIAPATNNWVQNDQSFPSFDPANIIHPYSNVPVYPNTDVTFDVTAYIQGLVNSESTSAPFVMTGMEGGDSFFNYVNILENNQVNYRPRLTIVYTTAAIPTVSSAGNLTNDTTPTWSWTHDVVNGKGTYRYQLNNSGTWTTITNTAFTPASALTDGTYTLTVQESNNDNYWSKSGSFTLTLDSIPPNAVNVISGASTTNDTTPTWTWSSGGGGNGTYRYELDDNDLSFGATETTTTTFTPGTLSQGIHTLYVQERDAAGNWSNSGSFTVTVDSTAPAAPTALALDNGSDTGNSDTDKITNDTTPTFTGMAEPGSTVTLYDTDGAAVLGTAASDASTGAWMITSVTLSSSSSGTSHNITAKATDAAGNVSALSSGILVTIDTSIGAPATPDLVRSSDSGSSTSDNITNDTTPTFVGTTEAGSTVTLYESSVILGTAVADGSGDWRITSSVLGDGSHSITAKAEDLAGNVSFASGEITITIDTIKPTVAISDPSASITAGGPIDYTVSFSGYSDITFVSSLISIAKIGSADASTVAVNSTTGDTRTVSLSDITGDGTIGIAIASGACSDTAGNLSDEVSSAVSFTADNTAPDAPSAPDLLSSSDVGYYDDDNITNNTTPTFSGRAEALSTVNLYDGTTLLGTGTASAVGEWTIMTSSLSDGDYTITATATDLLGNVSGVSASLGITIDTIATFCTSHT